MGPNHGMPGQPLSFRLLRGGVQLEVDRWGQLFNPDRYLGTDYVSSSSLHMEACPGGTLIATASVGGRYKVAAWIGQVDWAAYVLVTPSTVVPAIRGISFVVNGPLDRTHATQVFATARKTGATWASLVETGGIDLDSRNLQIQLPSTWTSGVESLNDLGWLIDAAHDAGFKVAVSPELWARSAGPPRQPDQVFGKLAGQYIADLPILLGPNSPLIPAVMRSYARFILNLAKLAQAHHADALFVGNETSFFDSPLLWQQRDQWSVLFTQLRISFSGQLWLSGINGCSTGPPLPQDLWINDYLDMWQRADGITAVQLQALKGSGPPCGWDQPGMDNPTADQMAANMQPALKVWFATQLSQKVQRPVIWTEFYPVAVDGVNHHQNGPGVLQLDKAARDNQEIVDYYEAQMRTRGQQPGIGYFIFSANLADNANGSFSDPLTQPELAAAIANWWGGDLSYFEPCFAPAPPHGLLLQERFEASGCPLDKQDAFNAGSTWRVVVDSRRPGNHVLRGSGVATTADAEVVPVIGASLWTDYNVAVRMRLLPGPRQSGSVSVRVNQSSDAYGISLGFNQLVLSKDLSSRGQYTNLATYWLPGGTVPNVWYQFEISAVGATITVRLDGRQVIRYTDKHAPLLAGGLVLGVGGGAGPATVEFDDILVHKQQ